MKTKEEIEQLATQDFNDRQECGHYELADLKSRDYYYDGFCNGYTQCQEDMADVIKQAIEYGYQLRCNHKPINSGIDWVKEFNSLNKQY